MKNIFLLFSLLFVGLTIQAKGISPVVIAMPDDLLIGISLEQRKALIAEVGDSVQVVFENSMGDEVKRLEFADDFISIQTSPVGILQVKLLPLVNNSNIIGVITTVCGRACDSKIDFYTTDWEPLDKSDIFPYLNKDSFLQSGVDRSTEAFINAYATLDMTPIVLSFSGLNKDVLAIYDIKKYLSKDDYEKLLPFLNVKPLIFTWDKFAFK